MDWSRALLSPPRWLAGQPRGSVLAALLCLGLSISNGAPGRGADLLLKADVQPLALRARTCAPAFIDVKLKSRQEALLEGVLELEITAGVETIYRQQTSELVLAPGVTTQRMLLPTTGASSGTAVEARLRFLHRKGIYDLGRFPITSESSFARQYVIGNCGSGGPSPPDRPRLWQALRPEWLFHDPDGTSRAIATVPVWIPAEDLPSAMGLCAFDVIAVEGASFAALDGKQLNGLATWVEAGGSLCVIPSAPLNAEHLAFLNALAGGSGAPAAVEMESGRKISIRGGPMLFRKPGLGRLVITLAAPFDEADLASPGWRRASSFLAKARAHTLMMAPLAPDAYSPGSRLSPAQRYSSGSVSPSYPNPPTDHAAEIQQALFGRLPSTSQMIPLPVIATILGAFIVLVGPGEWIVLGRLRRRRWTWISFPLLAAGFTLLGIRTAEYYLGRDDKLVTLVVTDVGAGGRVLRENRFQLWLAGHDKSLAVEMRQSLAHPCDPSRTGFVDDYSARSVARYEGQVPGHYTLRQPLHQWKPLVQRAVSFGPGASPPDIQWPEIDGRQLAGMQDQRRYFRQQVGTRGWDVEVFQLGKSVDHSNAGERFPGSLSAIDDSSASSWATALSPSGREDLQDLAIHDPTDPEEFFVVAMKATPGGLQIVRRLYHTIEAF